MTDKYKSFNLERALAGDKFIREYDKSEPSEWHYFKGVNDIVCAFPGEAELAKYTIYGERYHYGVSHRLLMLSKTKKLWIAIEKNFDELDGRMVALTTAAHLSEEDLFKGCLISPELFRKKHHILEIEVDDE